MQVPFIRALVVTTFIGLPAIASSQTITFDAIPNQILGVSPFTIAAEATSGAPVGFTSTTSTVCKLAANLVLLLKAGTCSVTADSIGATSVTRSFTVSEAKPSGSFETAAGSPFTVGTGTAGGGPKSMAVGDFNGDGRPDLAVVSYDGTLTVLLGNGTGGFTVATGSPPTVGYALDSVAVGDFNGDGKLDLAVANSDYDTVTVLLGNGAGGFTAAAGSTLTVGLSPQSLVVGDFNGDGKSDLAVANTNDGTVTVLLGNGSGGFAVATGSPFTAGFAPEAVVVGDFNGDGIQDLAAASVINSYVIVLLGNGSGGFTAAAGSPFTAGMDPASLVVGDFNGDGIQDLAAANFGDGTVTVLLGNGAGGFAEAAGSPFAVVGAPNPLVMGDFNGDGIEDLATANFDSNTVTVFLGNGAGGFAAATGNPFAVGGNPRFVTVGDFNGDGIEDLATANSGSYNVTVLLGLVVGHTSQTITLAALSNATYGVSPFTIGATASSGLVVSFSSPTSGVCSVIGTTVTIIGVGTCSIVASQAGNAIYAVAPAASQSFTVSQASQTITFGPLSNQTFEPFPLYLNATATSGLFITFTSNTPTVCFISYGPYEYNLTLLSFGTCSITANQSGSVGYAAAPAVTQTFTVLPSTPPLQLVTVAPCRIMDTRNANGPLGGPFIAAGETRSIPIPSGPCGIPANALAYALNVTVVPRTGSLGYLTVWPTDQSQPPLASTLNSPDGSILANAAIVQACTAGAVSAFATDDTELIIDINGDFVPPASDTLQFYPLPPCRVLDTRNPEGAFGGPALAGGGARSFEIVSSSCGVPAGAAAYSLNTTVVPHGELGYLTAWPTGEPQPSVSTLNSLDGTVLANAAIIPAGTGGAVSFFATNATDVVVDINGYFAAPGSGGLNFYASAPCRMVDTRNPPTYAFNWEDDIYSQTFLGAPTLGGGMDRTFGLAAALCGLPYYPSVQAYSLNMTVVPQGALGYLTTWPTGGSQPVVSTLNALKGQVVANAAIVPAGTFSAIDVFVTNTTDLIIDTNGFFGP
jgi:hypothetical protein